MKIIIISTGDELLRGVIADTNSAWIASRLFDVGLDVHKIMVVSDDLEDLTSTFKEAFNKYDVVIVGGGLGPTDDDLTTEAAAAATGLILETNKDAVSQIKTRFEKFGRDMHEINLKQAYLPHGCTLLENEWGTAPGFSLKVNNALAFFLPGVPREMKPMLEKYVISSLSSYCKERQRFVFKCFGMGESDIQALLKPMQTAHPKLRVAFRASSSEILVSMTANNASVLSLGVKDARLALTGVAFAEEETTLPAVLCKELLARNLKIATAESCTGGLIAHELTQIPGASECFKGSVVAYDNEIKISALNVDKDLIVKYGAVSEKVVSSMALGAAKAMNSDISVATSGVAGPGGGTEEKPVGLVHIAVANGQKLSCRRCMFKGKGREAIKTAAAWTAMSMILKTITETE